MAKHRDTFRFYEGFYYGDFTLQYWFRLDNNSVRDGLDDTVFLGDHFTLGSNFNASCAAWMELIKGQVGIGTIDKINFNFYF